MEKLSILPVVYLKSVELPFNHRAQLAPSGLGRSASLRAPGAGRYRAEQSSAYLAGWKSPLGKG